MEDEDGKCDECGGTPIRANLDGDNLCQRCCDQWAKGEALQAWLDARDAEFDDRWNARMAP